MTAKRSWQGRGPCARVSLRVFLGRSLFVPHRWLDGHSTPNSSPHPAITSLFLAIPDFAQLLEMWIENLASMTVSWVYFSQTCSYSRIK